MASQALIWLAFMFVALEFITFGAVVGGVMLPMARRSADDLAGLMHLSTQVWANLSPDARPAFEKELLDAHGLIVRSGHSTPPEAALRHGPYIWFLEQALHQRTSLPASFLESTDTRGETWLWTTIPTGEGSAVVGFDGRRMSTHPLAVLGLVLVAGTALAAGGAWTLAQRITKPIAQLDRATEAVAFGGMPTPVAESGPQEIARLASRFNLMATQVHELLDARTTLFAGLPHDLRTPLARMRLALEMLTLKPDPQWISRIERDIEIMNSLIGQLLDLARGMDHAPRTTIECGAWLGARAQEHATLAAVAHSTIRVVRPEATWLLVDAHALSRVVDNLLGNALRYAPGEVDLVVENRPQGVRIGVLDRGPGIPDEQLTQIWQPFHRLERSRSTQTGGYGLGLAIVRQLARAHGWQVTMTPRGGGGMAAWIDLGSGAAPSGMSSNL